MALRMRSAWALKAVSTSRRTPWAAPAASVISLANSSSMRLGPVAMASPCWLRPSGRRAERQAQGGESAQVHGAISIRQKKLLARIGTDAADTGDHGSTLQCDSGALVPSQEFGWHRTNAAKPMPATPSRFDPDGMLRISANRQIDCLGTFAALVRFGLETHLLAIFKTRKARDWTAEMWTKTSLPPSSGVMNPNPWHD